MAKQLTKESTLRLQTMYFKERCKVEDLASKFDIPCTKVIELVFGFTERELYKLYYAGLTPKFIALKLGVSESIILDWFWYTNNVKGWGKGKAGSSSYSWKQQKDDLMAKGKKVCDTKGEQERKCINVLSREVKTALDNTYMLNPEILVRLASKLGYKSMVTFEKALVIYGMLTPELEGILFKLGIKK